MKPTTKKIVVLGGIITILCLLWILSIYTAFTSLDSATEDPADYSSVLQSLRRPGSSALAFFPNEIPESAQNVYFRYHPPIGQGGKLLCLKYEIDIAAIQSYQTMAASKSVWSGPPTDKDAKSMGVYAESLAVFDYAENGVPSDFTVYLIHQEPSAQDDWNHGEVGLMGISMDTCEVLFMFHDW